MAELTGSVDNSTIVDGELHTDFRIPAFTKSGATQRAMALARAKGLRSPEVINSQSIHKASLPGQKMYIVTVASVR